MEHILRSKFQCLERQQILCLTSARSHQLSSDDIGALIGAGVCPRLLELITLKTFPSLTLPALRIVGVIVSGDENQTQESGEKGETKPKWDHLNRHLVPSSCAVRN
ncbi:importin subunit alpha-4-like isoform X1 [Macadamia integrifolia]|uniref:importin subunit alpha-4-like isoform X1 n=1 Tax=Macadamia integrifolia TaxID=60698 RepID=UPI001C4F522A|nr:importin subunit alpha-4-like isoform X1 [Macadamia integrifolia]